MTTREHLGRLLTLAGLARRLAALFGSGVNLARSLEIVGEEAGDSDFAEVMRDVHDQIMDGRTLSEALKDHPDWFNDVAINMVRAGEVGGVLDVTAHRWAKLLGREIELFERMQQHELMMGIARASGVTVRSGQETAGRQALAHNRPRLAAALFLDEFGVMLSSGVPLKHALRTAADALPRPAADRARELADNMTDETDLAAEMAEVPGLSGTVGELLRVGEMTGTLGEMCLRGSDMLRLEAEGEVRAALATYLET